MKKDKCYIEKVYFEKDKSTKPVLLKFQNGRLASVSKESTQYCAALHKEKKATGAVVAVNGHIYHGVTHQEEELTDSYICVRNRTTNKVRIIPIDQVLLNNHIYDVLEQESKLKSMSKETTAYALLKQFGGRKAIRSIDNANKMKVNVDIIKEDLDNTVKEADLEKGENGNACNQYYEHIRPKFNEEAKDLHEVYNIADIVPQGLLDRLEEEAATVHSTNIENLPINSEYLKDCIKNLQTSTPSVEGLMQIKLIIYMDALLNMIRTRIRRFDKMELSGITEKVENDIRSRFRDPNSKTMLRSSFSNEKALCYFIVLAVLMSKDYEIDLNNLTKELCMPKTRVVKFANIVCVKKLPRSDKLTLTLPSKMTPLPKAQSKTKRKNN